MLWCHFSLPSYMNPTYGQIPSKILYQWVTAECTNFSCLLFRDIGHLCNNRSVGYTYLFGMLLGNSSVLLFFKRINCVLPDGCTRCYRSLHQKHVQNITSSDIFKYTCSVWPTIQNLKILNVHDQRKQKQIKSLTMHNSRKHPDGPDWLHQFLFLGEERDPQTAHHLWPLQGRTAHPTECLQQPWARSGGPGALLPRLVGHDGPLLDSGSKLPKILAETVIVGF